MNENESAENIGNPQPSQEQEQTLKRTVLPAAGPEEMAKSARRKLEDLSMSWTKGRHEVHHRGIGHDNSRPRKYSKGPRK